MSVLNDLEIEHLGSKLIDPFDSACVQPASYDLSLHDELLIPRRRTGEVVDLQNYSPSQNAYLKTKLLPPAGQWLAEEYGHHCKDGFVLYPHGCVLGSTVERVAVPATLVARVEGKSSLGRLFLSAHVTAGFVDPGFLGQITLEIVNHGPYWILLRPGMKIAQVNFTRLTSPCERPYGSPGLGSHYQGQRGPTAGRG